MNGTIVFTDHKYIGLDTKIIRLSGVFQKDMITNVFLQMVAKVTHRHTSCMQTIEDIFNSVKGFCSSYLVLKFGNICPFVPEICPKMLFCKGHDHYSALCQKCDLPNIALYTSTTYVSKMEALWDN